MAAASASIIPECSICFGRLNTPKVLPCGDTFCLECINKIIGDKTETFPCPTCKQDVKIPEGGATNFILLQISKNTTQARDLPRSTTEPKCPNHNQREVDYYCNNCNIGVCSKCIIKQHRQHETLDIECDETRNKAIEKLQHSQDIIQNRIKNLEKTRFTLLESFEQVKSLCEDSCAKVIKKTEKIVSDLGQNCEKIIKDIRKNLEENRIKVEGREKEITSEIDLIKSDIESNISPSTKTTLFILQTLPRWIEKEKLAESRKDYNLCLQYLQWVGKDFSLDIDQLGSVTSKSFNMPGSYQFVFDVSDVDNCHSNYYSSERCRNNNLVWSCGVGRSGGQQGQLFTGILLFQDDNPKLNFCIIDYQLSLVNIDDDSKNKTKTYSGIRVERGGLRGLWHPITWSGLTDKKNCYLNSNDQFVIRFDIKLIREIEFNQ